MRLSLLLTDKRWSQDGQRLWKRGVIFQDNHLLMDTPREGSMNDLHCWLNRLNGFFSIVMRTEDGLLAAVDRVRSLPLFYALEGDNFYLADDAEYLRTKLSRTPIDSDSVEELRFTGYVTGKRTLIATISQLQAGEYLVATQTAEGWAVHTDRYYEFRSREPFFSGESAFDTNLTEVVFRCIDRLIHYADGRPIAIPLSSGADSRLIATALRYRNYSPLVSYTYGTRRSKDAVGASRIARALEIPWRFVEYTKEKWRYQWNSEQRRHYYRTASNWCSRPHLGDWIAIQELSDWLPSDTIFVPGHSGDFVAGSHIPCAYYHDGEFTKEHLITDIINYHYESENRESFRQRVAEALSTPEVMSRQQAVDAFELWDWQERQAKYIVNAVRLYEYWGYDWWLPLWDSEFVEFWQHVPLQFRFARRRYMQFVNKFCTHFGGKRMPSLPLPQAKTNKVGGLFHALKSKAWLLRNYGYLATKGILRSQRSVNYEYNQLFLQEILPTIYSETPCASGGRS
jgi:asparagine synthase (glutamine-hydrolysing)